MTEKELKELIKRLKYWLAGIIGSAILSIGGLFITSIITRAVDNERVNNIEKTQEEYKVLLNNKADISRVLEIKTELKSEIQDKFDAIAAQLNIIMKYTAPNNSDLRIQKTKVVASK